MNPLLPPGHLMQCLKEIFFNNKICGYFNLHSLQDYAFAYGND